MPAESVAELLVLPVLEAQGAACVDLAQLRRVLARHHEVQGLVQGDVRHLEVLGVPWVLAARRDFILQTAVVAEIPMATFAAGCVRQVDLKRTLPLAGPVSQDLQGVPPRIMNIHRTLGEEAMVHRPLEPVLDVLEVLVRIGAVPGGQAQRRIGALVWHSRMIRVQLTLLPIPEPMVLVLCANLEQRLVLPTMLPDAPFSIQVRKNRMPWLPKTRLSVDLLTEVGSRVAVPDQGVPLLACLVRHCLVSRSQPILARLAALLRAEPALVNAQEQAIVYDVLNVVTGYSARFCEAAAPRLHVQLGPHHVPLVIELRRLVDLHELRWHRLFEKIAAALSGDGIVGIDRVLE